MEHGLRINLLQWQADGMTRLVKYLHQTDYEYRPCLTACITKLWDQSSCYNVSSWLSTKCPCIILLRCTCT